MRELGLFCFSSWNNVRCWSLKCEYSRLTFSRISRYKEDYYDYGYLCLKRSYRAFSTRQVTESTGFKTDLSVPLLPQDVHCYRNLFYMTTHISAAQMLPTPHPPCLQHPSLLQLPRSTCGCCSSTLFINSFLMLPDGTTVIYGGPSVFTFMSMCMCVRGSIKSMHSEKICLHMWLIISNGKCVILISLHLRLFGSILHTAFALTQE